MEVRRFLLLTATAIAFLLASAVRVEAGNCTWLVVPPNVDFGNYSVFSPTPLEINTSFQVRCTPHTTATVTLTRGTSSTSYDPRTMGNGSELLSYNLYNDSSMTSIWGDGTGGSTEYWLFNATPREKVFDESMYARVFPGPDVSAGLYTDTITATLTWDGNSTDTRTFTVTVNILSECLVETFNVAFGTYDPVAAHLGTPLDATGQVRVYCTKGTTGMVSLSSGTNFAGGSRRMRGGADFLLYDIFRDSSYAGTWNSVNMNSGVSSSRLIPLAGGFTAFGRIPAAQNVAIGDYTDTVVATVNY
jgi:spore coat protein U-like protein